MSYELIPYEFDEKADLEASEAWFLDGMHPGPHTPMHCVYWCDLERHGFVYGSDKLSVPTSRGLDERIYHHRPYITPIIVTDEEEVKRREVVFRKNMAEWIDNFDKVWDTSKAYMLGLSEPIKKFDVEKACDRDLILHFDDVWHKGELMWIEHFATSQAHVAIVMMFEKACIDLFGFDSTDERYHLLASGEDNLILRTDHELWKLAQRANELGVSGIIESNELKNIITAMNESSVQGRQWVAELTEFLNIYGWRAEQMDELIFPSWLEDPTLALGRIKDCLPQQEFILGVKREVRLQQREELRNELLSNISLEKREWVKKLFNAVAKANAALLEHGLYQDQLWPILLRRALLEISKRFVEAGTFDKVDDIFFLIPGEVRKIGLMPQKYDYRPLVARRREALEQDRNFEAPPMLSKGISMEQAFGLLVKSGDPILIIGVVGKLPNVKPELKADIWGMNASSGVVEGTARVIMNVNELWQVQPGEILVAPVTYAAWTSVFSTIKGVITDRGGQVCHAAIVAREFGIPCVTNTFEATARIKTGQRIKMNGSVGAVWILD